VARGDHSQPIPKLLLLEELLCPAKMSASLAQELRCRADRADGYSQVLQVSSREWNMCHNLNLAIADLRDVDGVAEVSDTALNFDLIVQELFKGGEVENLIADRLGAVDGVLDADKVSDKKGYGSYLKQEIEWRTK
jgi:hypothetical protein